MTVSRRRALAFGAAVSGLTLRAAWAQGQPVPTGPPLAGVAPAGQPGAGLHQGEPGEDPLLAACLLLGGRRQIEVCQFALEVLQDEDCKAFAKAEIEEHQTIKADLQKLGYEYPAPPKDVPIAPPGAALAGQTAAPGGPRVAPGGQPAAAAGQPVPLFIAIGRLIVPPPASNLLKVEDELVTQCVATYRERMGQKQGDRFDKAFVGDQVHEHYALLDKAQVFGRHATPAMKPSLTKGLAVIQKHIQTLEQLKARFDHGGIK